MRTRFRSRCILSVTAPAFRIPGAKTFEEQAQTVREFYLKDGLMDLLREEYAKQGLYFLDIHIYGPVPCMNSIFDGIERLVKVIGDATSLIVSVDVSAEIIIEQGEIVDTILHQAKHHGCDLICSRGLYSTFRIDLCEYMIQDVLTHMQRKPAREMRPEEVGWGENLGFVDYIKLDQRATTVSLVIDRTARAATAVTGTLPTESETRIDAFSRILEDRELTDVHVQIARATIDTPFTSRAHPHGPTDELIGKRIQYVFSATEAYEHLYLNENLYTWQCLKGVEKGLADTDRCHYYKIDKDLYLRYRSGHHGLSLWLFQSILPGQCPHAIFAAWTPTPPPDNDHCGRFHTGYAPSKTPCPPWAISRYFAPCWMAMRPATSLMGVSKGSEPSTFWMVS